MLAVVVFGVLAVGGLTEATEELAMVSYLPQSSCTSDHIGEALKAQASCSPRAVTLRLPWPNSTMVGGGVRQMTPTHVTVMQCGGGCHRGSQGCLPTSTRQRQVSVMVGKCGVSVGKCDKECAVVRVEEHTQCGCGCQLERATCEAKGLHKFKPETCACECRDIQAKRTCLEQGRAWEEETCTCGCPTTLSCTSGNTYSSTTCMCEPTKVDDQLGSNAIPGGRSTRDYLGDIVSWELVTIVVLLCLVLALLSIIFSLVARLHRMRRALKLKDFSVMEGDYHIYGEIPARKVTVQMEERDCDKTYLEIASVSSSSGFGSDVSKADRESPAEETEQLYGKVKKARVKDETGPSNGVRQRDGVDEVLVREERQGPPPVQARRGTGEAVRQTKSGIFRGPAPEPSLLPRPSLDPIDEALRLLQESAQQL